MDADQATFATLKWVDRYARALDSVETDGSRQQFLCDLVDASIQVSRAGRAYGILMHRDEVLSEQAFTASGDPWTAADEVRSMAARLTLRAIVRSLPQEPNPGLLPIQLLEDTATLPFLVRPGIGGAVVLLEVDASRDGERDLGLTAALVLSRACTLAAREERNEAAARAARSELRLRELERAVTLGGVGAVAYLKPVGDLQRDAIELALRTTRWNKEEAARRLGMSRASLYNKIRKYGLTRPAASEPMPRRDFSGLQPHLRAEPWESAPLLP